MNGLHGRVWLAATLMVFCYLGTTWLRAGYSFDVMPLRHGLDSIPQSFDGWVSEDLPLDDRIAEILNAQQTLNRLYRNRDQGAVVLNVSAWLQPETVSEVAPHIPKTCYTNSGWTILENRDVRFTTSRGVLPATTMLLERHGERIVVAYWYQMGDSYFTSADEARRIHRGLWGQQHWPATIKVLMQVPATSIEAGLSRLERFATQVDQQVSGL